MGLVEGRITEEVTCRHLVVLHSFSIGNLRVPMWTLIFLTFRLFCSKRFSILVGIINLNLHLSPYFIDYTGNQ